jgi:hypothetical protein
LDGVQLDINVRKIQDAAFHQVDVKLLGARSDVRARRMHSAADNNEMKQ